MNEKNKDIALFRLSVLGPIVSRVKLARGELKKLTYELSNKSYLIPYSKRCYVSAKTIERWYYDWRHHGFEGLFPKQRVDHGHTKINKVIQEKVLEFKKDNPARSLNTIIYLLEAQGLVAQHDMSRATLHRFLQRHHCSKRTLSDAARIERRCFEAKHAGDIWHGDVMHGPAIFTPSGKRKVYLVSLLDDASRLIAHSEFCLGETALDIEGVLKQALLKRGIPNRIIIDNGAAYRSKNLQMICARLDIRLVYCPAYEPEGKGKLERWHRTFRDQFLSELIVEKIKNLSDLNGRLWSWVEQIYHQRIHSRLNGETPLERWRRDLVHVRALGCFSTHIDDYFYHRVKRIIKKDATVTWEGSLFEVPYEYSEQTVYLVVDPHQEKALKIESLEGKYLGEVHPLDALKNCHRKRQRPRSVQKNHTHKKHSAVEMAYEDFKKRCSLTPKHKKEN